MCLLTETENHISEEQFKKSRVEPLLMQKVTKKNSIIQHSVHQIQKKKKV